MYYICSIIMHDDYSYRIMLSIELQYDSLKYPRQIKCHIIISSENYFKCFKKKL